MRLKKGSKEAKEYMAKLRKKKAKTVGAKPTKKTAKKVVKKRAVKTSNPKHVDTKSHNVNIRVVSGIGSLKKDQAEYKKKLDYANKLLATVIGNVAFYREMQKTDKAKRAYYGVKVKEEKAKIPQIKKAIANYKKLVK